MASSYHSHENVTSGSHVRRWLGVVLGLVWTIARLPVFVFLSVCEPFVRIVGTTIAMAGVLISVFLELSGAAPQFPFWGALAVFLGFGALPIACRALIRMVSLPGN